jgi:hypothetical protein
VLQLVFAIFLMLGAWTAWRRNPMYSARSTLRAAVIILLAIAGLIALIVATVNFTINRSPVVAGGALAAVIIVGALSMIFLIQAVTVPRESKPAALPHSVKLVTTNRRKIYTWLKVFAILIGVFALGGLIPGAARYISLTLGGFTLLLAIILLPVLYVTSRGFDQSLTELELNPWVHWLYTAEQWTAWSDIQADRAAATPPTFLLRRDWRRLAWPLIAIVIGVYFFVPGPWLWKTAYILFICAAIVSIAALGGRSASSTSEKLRAKLLAASPEAWFGRDGVFCDGVFTPWLNVSTYLLAAEIDQRQPRSLLFRFERSVPNPYGPTQAIPIHQSVLIPASANSNADLIRLQHELTARCPKASIALA